ncbi:SDR family NAD(P)-dependent oxidoreductase [Rhodococcus pseudokoreensis]|uniref:SDR family NAD(P)-dependent oxidoreductase n=1 Tax=Rhodococcus pseudokoreensis TaxID=2811421 RepID=A0A974ZVI0_9NOCA|nr:SDR family NAD(P)-dependent oxidoreductase [Rhodococcus pseudokoreensis]
MLRRDGNVVQGTLEELSLDQVRAQLETNVVGLVAVAKAVLPGMRQRRSGHIINFSSGGGLVGVPRLDACVRVQVRGRGTERGTVAGCGSPRSPGGHRRAGGLPHRAR